MILSYKIFMDKGIDLDTYTKNKRDAVWLTTGQVIRNMRADRIKLVPILKVHFPQFVTTDVNILGESYNSIEPFIDYVLTVWHKH
jgi:hypothetical protein